MTKPKERIAIALENMVMQLRRRNDQAEAFYREVLDVLSAAKDPEGSLSSGQPAAATWCQVCGRASGLAECESGELTREQWEAHWELLNRTRREAGANEMQAQWYADDWMSERFGPCPEES